MARPKTNPIDRFNTKYVVDEDTGCFNWIAATMIKGYGIIRINKKNTLAHRFAYEYYVGPINNLHVLHRCDNRKCVNYNHLFLGTNQDNVDDKVSKNRHNYGQKVWNHKLSEDEVIQIKKELQHYYRGQCKDLAHFYKVDPRYISAIKCGETWSYIKI